MRMDVRRRAQHRLRRFLAVVPCFLLWNSPKRGPGGVVLLGLRPSARRTERGVRLQKERQRVANNQFIAVGCEKGRQLRRMAPGAHRRHHHASTTNKTATTPNANMGLYSRSKCGLPLPSSATMMMSLLSTTHVPIHMSPRTSYPQNLLATSCVDSPASPPLSPGPLPHHRPTAPHENVHYSAHPLTPRS